MKTHEITYNDYKSVDPDDQQYKESPPMDKQALEALIAKVEANQWDCLDKDYPLPYQTYANFGRAYEDGSLDAAKALHDAVLPGWPVQLTDHTPDWCGGYGWCASLNYPHMEWQKTFKAYPPSHYAHSAYSHDPARAWLLAMLRALSAQEGV